MDRELYLSSIYMNSLARLNKISLVNNDEKAALLVKYGLIHKDLYSNAMMLYNTANEIYPNECDLQISLAVRDHSRRLIKTDNTPVSYDMALVIHFPSFIVTNSSHEHITVKDFFFRMIFTIDGSRFIINEFSGSRTTFSYADHTSNYRWSHLSRKGDSSYPPVFTSFCFGDGDIPLLRNQFNQTPDRSPRNVSTESAKIAVTREQIFRLLLLNIESYLKWESLEGGPHHRMADVFAHGNIWTPTLITNEVVHDRCDRIMNNYKHLIDCDIVFSNGTYQIVDNQKFDLSLANIIKNNFSSERSRNLLFKKGDDGTLYEISSVRTKGKVSDIPLIFQEKEYFCTVESDTVHIDNDTFYTNPLLKQYAKSILDYAINYESTKSSFIKRLQN